MARITIDGIDTEIIDEGSGPVVVLLHGSGPGVSATANWRLVVPRLVEAGYRVVAPDQIGFGQTVPPEGHDYTMQSWARHAAAVIDHLDVGPVALVGNSFGGAIAMRVAIERPELVSRLVLMGSVGVPFDIVEGEGLDAVWGYDPSPAEMKRLLGIFAYDQSLADDDELAQLRYEASIADGAADRFAAMFPAPRQRWVDAMASDDEEIRGISVPTLIVHGREDQVIPVATSHRLFELITPAELHVFGECGHWTQIEKTERFCELVADFCR